MSYFSIIIPTYNSASTLQNCLESIISQSFTDFEVHIIDGVSKDNTLEIVKSFNDKRIQILSEIDNGIYDAMNKGIKLAKGKWLYFLGSDDQLFDSRVLNEIYITSKHTRSKVIYGSVKILGNAGWANDGDIYDGAFTLKKILEKNICHQAMFYDCQIFKRIGVYNLNFEVWSDWDFNLKAYLKFTFEYKNLTIARFFGGNTSFSVSDDVFLDKRWESIYTNFKWKLYKSDFMIYIPNILQSIRLNSKYNIIDFLNIKFQRILNKILNDKNSPYSNISSTISPNTRK